MTKRFDVFLSHNSIDKPWVTKLKQALEDRGLKVWIDRYEIRPGDLFVNALEIGINQCKAVALIVSPDSMRSAWVREEYSRALALAQETELQLIPVILRGAELPGFLSNRNWVDFREEASFAESLERLIWGITGDPMLRDANEKAKMKPTFGQVSSVELLYEREPDYPCLDFSICNRSNARATVTEIRVAKAATVKDEHGSFSFFTGPKMKLEFSLRDSVEGIWQRTFRHKVTKLDPGECDTFQLELDCENTLNLVDIELEFLIADSVKPHRYSPSDIVVVHAPVSDEYPASEEESGAILVIDRMQAIRALLDEKQLTLWPGKAYSDCANLLPLFLRGAAFLARMNIAENWEILRDRFERDKQWGPILASFSDFAVRNEVPPAVLEYLRACVRDPKLIKRMALWDTESFSATVLSNLEKINQREMKDE